MENIQNSQNPMAQPPLEPLKQKPLPPKIWIPVLAVVALAVAYLGVASLYDTWPFGDSNVENGISNMEDSKIPSPRDGEGKGEVANWQTYRNEEFGFEVRYPGHLEAFTDQALIYTISNKSLPGPKFDLNVCFAPAIRDEFKRFPKSCEFEVYVTKDVSELEPNKPIWTSKGDICPSRPLLAPPVLDDAMGNQVDICFDGSLVLRNVYVVRNNQAHLFATQEVGQSKLAQFNQILSTFKFIQ